MRFGSRRGGVVLALAAAVGLVAVGCGKDREQKASQGQDKMVKAADNKAAGGDKKVHDHSDWWCAEHGIPEHLCSMCNEKVAAECKKKGDWCKKHDRARSQCFICDPRLKEKYAAMYRAKYDKEPPPIEE